MNTDRAARTPGINPTPPLGGRTKKPYPVDKRVRNAVTTNWTATASPDLDRFKARGRLSRLRPVRRAGQEVPAITGSRFGMMTSRRSAGQPRSGNRVQSGLGLMSNSVCSMSRRSMTAANRIRTWRTFKNGNWRTWPRMTAIHLSSGSWSAYPEPPPAAGGSA